MACRKCSACKNEYKVNCIPFSGNKNADIYFLGEMAGANEAKKSKIEPSHFIGKAGENFNYLLTFPKIDRKDVAIANSLRCYKANNAIPKKKELDQCFIYTMREINRIKPKLVVAMGAVAAYQVLNVDEKDFKFYKGRLIWSDKIKCNVFVTNHPAAIIYNNAKKTLEKHFSKIREYVNRPPAIQQHYDFTIIENIKQLKSIVRRALKGNLLVGFDAEMTGLDPYDEDEEFKTLQFGFSEDEIYVLPKKLIYEGKDILRKMFESCPIMGQGFSFDAKWLYERLGFIPSNFEYDTCLAEYLISGMKNNDLEFLTGKYNTKYFGYWFDVGAAGGAHKVMNDKVLTQYGADDVGTMFPIREEQLKDLEKKDMLFLFNKIWMPCDKVLTKMSLRGVKFDINRVNELDAKFAKQAKKLLFRAKTLPGIKETEEYFGRTFNPRSSEMLRYLLIEYYKLPVLQRTKPSDSSPDGNPKVSQDEMEIYAKQNGNEYCKIMTSYRSLQQVRNNFLSGVIPKLVDGVAHTKYSIHATATGRPNSRNPNLLNYPSKKDYKIVKSCIVPRDDFVFLAADMSQAEVRVAAVIYDDENLITACNEEGKDDFHSVITSKVYHKPYEWIYTRYNNEDHPDHEEVTEWRRKCKTITFGILYQQGAESLAYALGISLREAEEFIKTYFRGFPDLERNIEKQKDFTRRYGYAKTYFGHRRFFQRGTWDDADTLRKAVNSPIQGTAWNLMQLSLIEVDKVLTENNMKSGLVLQVYDSMVVEAHKDEVDDVAKLMKRTMETIHLPYEGLNRVKLKTDVEIGNNLHEMRRYEGI